MEMHEYLDLLTGQIRNKKAGASVAKEIKSHMEDQAQVYMEQGMGQEEALAEAVRQMGNPVEVGIDMDRIHRPRNNWKLLGAMAVLSLVGLLVQYLCIYRFGGDQLAGTGGGHAFMRQCLYTFLGLAGMALLYFFDYSMFSRYGGGIGFLFLAAIALACILGFARKANGGHSYLKPIMYLFIPVYSGILYRYRGRGYACIAGSLLWLFAAAWVGFGVIGGGISITLDVMFVCCLMFTAALIKNWYQVKHRWLPLSGLGIMSLLLGVLSFVNMAPYQYRRIMAYLNPRAYAKEGSFVTLKVREMISQLKPIGGMQGRGYGLSETPAHVLPWGQSDFVILQAASMWGTLAAFGLAALLILFLSGLFFMVKRQKNQLGQMIGYGCVLILVIETATHLLNNLGILYLSSAGLPFFTFGLYHTVAVYGLLGILFSIYRYQDLVWEPGAEEKNREKGILAYLGKYRIRIERTDV